MTMPEVLVTLTESKLLDMMTEAGLRGITQTLAEERALVRPLLVDLAVFADGHHDFKSGVCRPQPGVGCWPFCDACKLLARVPADVVTEARRVREVRES